MADENSTANQTVGNIKDTTPNVFFNAAWQLALNLEFHLRFAVIAVGVFGAAANALVIYALIAHHMHDTKKRAVNLLIINQNLLDFACCLLLAISFSTNHLYLKGTLGYIVCVLFTNSTLSEGVLCGSVINLVAVTVERYLKVVHPFWSKKYLKRRMIYAAIGFAWIGGAVFVTPMSIIWSRVETGFCISYYNLSTDWSYESCRFVFFSVFPLAIFIYCYGRMVVVMKRQMRVMAGHNAEGSAQMNASQAQSQRVKWNIIKTMIIVSVAFVVCWFPSSIFFLILPSLMQTYDPVSLAIGGYLTVFLAYLNSCLNPFIYATKHEGVKRQLARLVMVCRRAPAVGDEPGTTNSSRAAAATGQTRSTLAHR